MEIMSREKGRAAPEGLLRSREREFLEICAAACLLGCFVTSFQLCPGGLSCALEVGAVIKGIRAPGQCQQSGGCSGWGFVRVPRCVTGVQEALYLPLRDWMVKPQPGEELWGRTRLFKKSHFLISVEIYRGEGTQRLSWVPAQKISSSCGLKIPGF